MRLLSSLQSRIFLACALLAVICIATALALVNVRVTQEAERTLEREIVATGAPGRGLEVLKVFGAGST